MNYCRSSAGSCFLQGSMLAATRFAIMLIYLDCSCRSKQINRSIFLSISSKRDKQFGFRKVHAEKISVVHQHGIDPTIFVNITWRYYVDRALRFYFPENASNLRLDFLFFLVFECSCRVPRTFIAHFRELCRLKVASVIAI